MFIKQHLPTAPGIRSLLNISVYVSRMVTVPKSIKHLKLSHTMLNTNDTTNLIQRQLYLHAGTLIMAFHL